ncbi:glycosyltransferase [Empedobacter falsenii]
MINLPKVSVVTITYGHQDYIIETIKGVLKQNYTGKIEFIISNDNSPDDTDQVISDFFKSIEIPQNFEINYINHATNIGVMPNFYDALTKASGDYIALCDGDDYWTDENKLQKQIDFLEENEDYVLVGHNVRIFENETNETINSSFPFTNSIKPSKNYIFLDNYIPALSIVFKNKYEIPKWLLGCKIGDYPLILFLEQFGQIGFIDDIMASYRSNSGYHSSLDKNKRNQLFLQSIEIVKQNISLTKTQLNNLNYQILLIQLRDNNFAKSVKMILGTSTSLKFKLKSFLKIIK